MTNLPVPRSGNFPAKRSLQGELVNTDLVNTVYDELGLDELLQTYASHSGDRFIEEDIGMAFANFAVELASMSHASGRIDVALIREGFDRTYAGMNLAAGKARGLEQCKGAINQLLVRAGVRQPDYQRVLVPLDDKYWNEQFLQQFHEGTMVKRFPDEPEQVYLARYIQACLHGFPWAYFTHSV